MLEELLSQAFWIGLAKIIGVNIILSGDNAVVIALAARSLPQKQQKQAIFWGAGAAIVLRIALTLFAVALLTLPWLKLVGGLLLFWIGVKLLIPEDEGPDIKAHEHLMSAIKTILIADLVMSLDNVIAVAAAAEQGPAEGKIILLVLGLGLSIPIVIFGSTLLLVVMERYPIIITIGAALLGWIAGEMAVTDPAVAESVKANAAWLHDWKMAAIAGAALVVAAGKWLAARHDTELAQAQPAADTERTKG
jgi:YjbE family integral membrane protein